MIIDKFSVINNLQENTDKFVSIIKNYIENYLESDLSIYHPDYIYQIIFKNKVEFELINTIFDELLNRNLIQKRQNIRDSIKKNKFSLKSQNQLITNLNNKILYLSTLLNLKNKNNFINKILSDPILINYLEVELSNTDAETLIEIQNLNNLIKLTDNDNYIWFIKLLGSVIRNNIPDINASLSDKYKCLYKLNAMIEYINNIKQLYNFIERINILINPLNEILEKYLIDAIKYSNIVELLNLMTNYTEVFLNIDKTIKPNVIVAVNNKLNDNIQDNKSYDYVYDLVNILIKCNNLNILESYILLIFENNQIIAIIQEIIHNEINQNLFLIIELVNLLTIKDTETFIINYQKLLIERLLSEKTNIVNEITIQRELQKKFGLRTVSKITKIIEDYKLSLDNIDIFKNKLLINNFMTITTSYSNWDINYNKGYISFDNFREDSCFFLDVIFKDNPQNLNRIDNYLKVYEKYYRKIYLNNRKLLWLPQYGEVDIIFNNQNIILLPIQLMILELFNDRDNILLNDINDQNFLKNYSDDYKLLLIKSLVKGKILIMKNNILELNYGKVENNLIDIFNNLELNDIQIENNFISAFNPEDIVKTIINHYIKIEPRNKNDLYEIINKDIKNFRLNKILFNNVIEYMIKMDYIIIQNDKITKCFY